MYKNVSINTYMIEFYNHGPITRRVSCKKSGLYVNPSVCLTVNASILM